MRRDSALYEFTIDVGGVAQWLGRRSLAGGLSQPCARSMVNCPLWISQPGNSAFCPSAVGKWVVIAVFTWIAEVETI